MSSRWSSSSGVSSGTLARLAACAVPSSRSALISERVISTSEPSPMRVGILGSKRITSAFVRGMRRRMPGVRVRERSLPRGLDSTTLPCRRAIVPRRNGSLPDWLIAVGSPSVCAGRGIAAARGPRLPRIGAGTAVRRGQPVSGARGVTVPGGRACRQRPARTPDSAITTCTPATPTAKASRPSSSSGRSSSVSARSASPTTSCRPASARRATTACRSTASTTTWRRCCTAAAAYPEIRVLCSVEADYLPEHEDALAAILRQYPFDYVHRLDPLRRRLRLRRRGQAHDPRWDDVDAVFRGYYEATRLAAASGLFDIMAHVGYVALWGHEPGPAVAGARAAALQAIADAGMVLEVNTGGPLDPLELLYPFPHQLRDGARPGHPHHPELRRPPPGPAGDALRRRPRAGARGGVTTAVRMSDGSDVPLPD